MILRNRIGRWLAGRLAPRLSRVMHQRAPDFVIGDASLPYLMRWYIVPRNPLLNVYLHCFLRDDDDRACHCHPWPSLSLALGGTMKEVFLRDGVERCRFVEPGDVVCRRAAWKHRMVVLGREHPVTLFITGPRVREWYFWCEGKRPVHWSVFTKTGAKGQIGAGCD